MNRRLLLALLMTLLTLSAGASHILLAQNRPKMELEIGPSTASQSIEILTQHILNTLNTRRAEFTDNRDALRAFVSELDVIFDRTYSARMVLGRHARGADETDIALFADALIDGLLQRYGTLLLDINAQLSIRIKSESALPRDMGVRVSSEIIRPGEAPIALDYLLHQRDGEWKVFDIIVEGVSMVQTLRQQFDAELQRKSIREVANELRTGQLQASAD